MHHEAELSWLSPTQNNIVDRQYQPPSAPPIDHYNQLGDTDMTTMHPPTYEECMYMETDNTMPTMVASTDDGATTTTAAGDESVMIDNTYRPLYPIYATLGGGIR